MSHNDYEVDERTGAWVSPAYRDQIAQKWAEFFPVADPAGQAEPADDEPEPIGKSSVIPGAGSSPGYEAQGAMAEQYAQTAEDKTTQLARLLGWL